MIHQPLANKRNYGTIMNNPFYAKSTRAFSRQQIWAGTILHWPIKSPHPQVTFCQIGGSDSKSWPKKIGSGKSYRLSNGCPLETQNNLILKKSFALESNPRTTSNLWCLLTGAIYSVSTKSSMITAGLAGIADQKPISVLRCFKGRNESNLVGYFTPQARPPK